MAQNIVSSVKKRKKKKEEEVKTNTDKQVIRELPKTAPQPEVFVAGESKGRAYDEAIAMGMSVEEALKRQALYDKPASPGMGPVETPTPTVQPKTTPKAPEGPGRILTNVDTGAAGGIEIRGKTYLGPMNIQQEQAAVERFGVTPRPTAEEAFAEKMDTERKRESIQVAEEAGVFEARPEITELSPDQSGLKYTNRQLKAVNELADEFLSTVSDKDTAQLAKEYGIPEDRFADLIQNPETQREFMLQEIQRNEMNKTRTASQKLGKLMEPIIGDLKVFDLDVGKYASNLLRMPTEEVYEIVDTIGEVESSVSGMTDAASQGELGDPNSVLLELAKEEEKIYRYEARIKRLIIDSSELKANPEKVNLIEEKILKAKRTIYEAKQRAAEGAIITPTDGHLQMTLAEARSKYS